MNNCNDIALLQRLLDLHVDPFLADASGQTPLHLAVRIRKDGFLSAILNLTRHSIPMVYSNFRFDLMSIAILANNLYATTVLSSYIPVQPSHLFLTGLCAGEESDGIF